MLATGRGRGTRRRRGSDRVRARQNRGGDGGPWAEGRPTEWWSCGAPMVSAASPTWRAEMLTITPGADDRRSTGHGVRGSWPVWHRYPGGLRPRHPTSAEVGAGAVNPGVRRLGPDSAACGSSMLTSRVQFGRPLAKFQAVPNLCATSRPRLRSTVPRPRQHLDRGMASDTLGSKLGFPGRRCAFVFRSREPQLWSQRPPGARSHRHHP